MSQTVIDSDLYCSGTLSTKYFSAPPNSINDAAVQAGTNIQATKVVHQVPVRYDQKPGTAVVAETKLLHLVYASATVVAVNVVTTTPPTGSDAVHVDVQRATSSTSFATLLTATVNLVAATAAKTVVSGTLSTTALSAGDVLQVVVTATGSSCQGLLVSVVLRENAQ